MATKRQVKTTTTKKKPAKRTVSARAKANKEQQMKSFHVYRDTKPFTRVEVTRQTLYWIVLLAVIVVLQLWILKIQLDIVDFTNTILLSQ